MPRLSTDAIKQGLLHPDADVRFTALRYFAEARSRDQSVMPVVIDALKQFGRTRTFRFLHPITQLAQSESTIRWAVEELTSVSPRDEEERDYLGMITKLLCSADPRLVLPHKSDVLAAAAFDASDRRRLTNRIRLLSRTGDELWRELETICDEAKTKQSVNDVRWFDGIDIVEELARQGEQHSDRVMGLLKIRIENYEGNPHTWMEPLAVRLAGELRHEPALPLLVAKLHEDDEILSEQCQQALVKIGTDTVIQSVREEYPTAEWHFRLYSNRVFSDIHSDLAVRAAIELLETEDDLDLQVWLAEACVQQLSTEGAEAAYRLLREDPDLRSLRDGLIAACTLLGQEFPELEQWRKESRDEKRHKPFMFGGPEVPLPLPQIPQPITRVTAIPKPPTPVQRTSQKVGRNDPCPCGSGKKFKKCCMAKGGGEL